MLLELEYVKFTVLTVNNKIYCFARHLGFVLFLFVFFKLMLESSFCLVLF